MNILKEIRRELCRKADKKTRNGTKRFFKEAVNPYGVKTDLVRKVAIRFFGRIKGKNKAQVFRLCGRLWRSGRLEETFIACDWSYRVRKNFEPADFKVFEKWVKAHVDNWASCDTFCNHTVGSFVEMYPAFLPGLKKWTQSPNRWVRRAAAVTLIVPARQGLFLKDVFKIADALLIDEDDLVQKGYGWLLKAASQAHPRQVFSYVMKNRKRMPRTAFRYAIEKMPRAWKKKAMTPVGKRENVKRLSNG